MSEPEQQETHEQREPPAEGPGSRLREAREARGLSREDVAHELRLHVDLVRALEEDDSEHLPPAAFVTGYLRNYARLLELPEQEIVERHERKGAEPELVSYGQDTQVRASDLPVRLVTYVVIIALAVLGIVWWFSKGPEEGAPVAPSPEAEQAPGQEPSLGDEGLESPLEPQAPVAVPDESGAAEQEAPAEPAPPGTGVAEPPGAEAVEPPLPEAGERQLRAVFTADSWVDITDADGNKLAYGLINEGRELSLEGEPPFRVFLGYAPGVTLYYRGEQFDTSAFVRRNETARFRVGSETE